MADRNQYPMMPQNFNPSLLQQHQLQQAQQQAGLNNNNLGGIPNADSARMWQAMQKAQDTYRAQNGTGMTETQVNQQMASLLQSQNLARMQAQHMGQPSQQQQQQQQFGLAAAQIAGQQPQQHAGFHDQPQGQAQMPAQFGGMNPGASQNFGNNRAAMMQAFNQNQVSRQLELMGMAQNQQHQSPQAAPANFAGRMAQQGGMGQAGQPQGSPMFSAGQPQAEGSRASPPHPAQLPNQPGAQGLPAGRRPMNFNELRDRAMQIQAYITQQENLAMSLNTQRQGMDPNLFMSKMQTLAGEVRNKKELLGKLTAAMSAAGAQAQQQHQGPNPGMGSSPAPQHQQLGPSGQAQPAWMAQHGTAQAQGLQMARAALPSRGPSQPQNMQTSPQIHSASLMQQNGMGVPQRPGSTMAPGQLPNQAAQFMQQQQAQQQEQQRLQQQQAAMQQQAQQQNGMPNQSLPPPLDKAKFEESYAAYRNNRPVNINEQMMQIDNRPIDLHALHFHVLTEGGGNKVTSLDAWSMIGARIGFQAFPATDSKPAMAGPGVGERLRHIYAEYLQQFETIYVRSVLQKKGMFPPNGNVPGNPGQMNNGGPAANAAQMNAMMMYAHVPAADLHARGVPENVIRFVEAHRAQLQRSVKQQMSFRGVVQNAGAASGEQGLGANGQFSQPQAGPGPSVAQSQTRGPQQGLSPAGMSLAPHNGQPPNMNGGMAQQGLRPTRPSPEQSHQASNFVAHVKTEFLKNNLPNMTQHAVPDQEKVEYNRVLEQAFHASQEMDPKLPMFFYVLKDGDLIKKLVAIILTTREQRSLISNGTQKYILSLITLRNIIQQLGKCNAQFAAAVQGFTSQPQASAAPASPNPGPNGAPPRPPVIPQQPQYQAQQHPSPHRQPTPQSTQLTPSLAAQSLAGNRPVTLNQPPPAKRKPQPPHQPNVSTPSAPTPPASTPAAVTPSAATPAATAASPKTPKSPKVKAGVKPKPAPPTKPRKNSKAAPPIPEPAPPSAPSPSSSLKRPREDEETNAGTSAVSAAPSPKKAKTEWEAPPSEEVIKKEQQIDNIKTDEDANAFLQQMTELLQMAAGNDGEEMSNISETLDMILKGCGQDASDLGASGSGIMPDMSASDTNAPNADEFQDYFDFTTCVPDEDSKPATPDLVSSSSTNPSPESASDPADAATAAGDNRLANLKVEHTYDNDSLRLGAWKEIDGGESAYYHSDRWNWEAPMQVLDQPWAFAS